MQHGLAPLHGGNELVRALRLALLLLRSERDQLRQTCFQRLDLILVCICFLLERRIAARRLGFLDARLFHDAILGFFIAVGTYGKATT